MGDDTSLGQESENLLGPLYDTCPLRDRVVLFGILFVLFGIFSWPTSHGSQA